MAFPYLILMYFLIYLKFTENYRIHDKFPEINVADSDINLHLKYKHIVYICNNRDVVCKVNNTNICALRFFNEKIEYKDFINACYLFLGNMCDYPGSEFSIAASKNCTYYLKSRRQINISQKVTNDTGIFNGTSEDLSVDPGNLTLTEKPILRAETTFMTLYDVDTAFDYHICPLSCPDTYSPVCVSVNRGFGKYFKFFTFINHCAGDIYYCSHWQEFSPPPDEDEKVSSSPLGWSYCGASRYLQFARFAEAASSMGHYGWLAGDYKYSHIMEPSQRLPGYG